MSRVGVMTAPKPHEANGHTVPAPPVGPDRPPAGEPSCGLAALAERIRDRESLAGRDLLEHARRQGEDLLRVQDEVGARKFAPWLRENVPGLTTRTADNYKRIAREWEAIPETVSGIAAALRWLRLPGANGADESADSESGVETEAAGDPVSPGPRESDDRPPIDPEADPGSKWEPAGVPDAVPLRPSQSAPPDDIDDVDDNAGGYAEADDVREPDPAPGPDDGNPAPESGTPTSKYTRPYVLKLTGEHWTRLGEMVGLLLKVFGVETKEDVIYRAVEDRFNEEVKKGVARG